MRKLLNHLTQRSQRTPLPGHDQVRNSAGGYVFDVGHWGQLERFLVLGSEGGTYYVRAQALTIDAANCVVECLADDPERAVRVIADVSRAGRAPSNRPALFALALAFCEPKAVPFARVAFTDIARTGTHLFEFLTAVRAMRGFGRALRGAVADWYLSKSVDGLAYQLVKYRQRSGWTHRDALRLAHPKDAERDALFAWAVGKSAGDLPPIVRGYVIAQTARVQDLPAIVREYRLTHEMLPSGALTDRHVLAALAESMPIGALVRFLGRLSKAGLLKGNRRLVLDVCARLRSADEIRAARLHPMAILVALRTYAAGRGVAGGLTWPVNGHVVDALNDAFHLAFANVEPSGKRVLVAVDVSGSMSWNHCAGAQALTCAEGATALAMVTARTEPWTLVKAFNHAFSDLPISPKQRLDDALRVADRMNFGATDCAQPMIWARENREQVDAFVVLTDNETWFGDTHPCEALRLYRDAMGIDARLVVVGMTGSDVSIADPNDPGTLDVVGFDAAAPRVISDFIAGRI